MKEFIEKQIERLEELSIPIYDSDGEIKNKVVFTDIAKNIVNELAEEYINTSTDTSIDTSIDTSSGYCEWKPIDEEKSIYKSVCKKQSLYDGNPTESMYEFCPYCGKKIKVVE